MVKTACGNCCGDLPIAIDWSDLDGDGATSDDYDFGFIQDAVRVYKWPGVYFAQSCSIDWANPLTSTGRREDPLCPSVRISATPGNALTQVCADPATGGADPLDGLFVPDACTQLAALPVGVADPDGFVFAIDENGVCARIPAPCGCPITPDGQDYPLDPAGRPIIGIDNGEIPVGGGLPPLYPYDPLTGRWSVPEGGDICAQALLVVQADAEVDDRVFTVGADGECRLTPLPLGVLQSTGPLGSAGTPFVDVNPAGLARVVWQSGEEADWDADFPGTTGGIAVCGSKVYRDPATGRLYGPPDECNLGLLAFSTTGTLADINGPLALGPTNVGPQTFVTWTNPDCYPHRVRIEHQLVHGDVVTTGGNTIFIEVLTSLNGGPFTSILHQKIGSGGSGPGTTIRHDVSRQKQDRMVTVLPGATFTVAQQYRYSADIAGTAQGLVSEPAQQIAMFDEGRAC